MECLQNFGCIRIKFKVHKVCKVHKVKKHFLFPRKRESRGKLIKTGFPFSWE